MLRAGLPRARPGVLGRPGCQERSCRLVASGLERLGPHRGLRVSERTQSSQTELSMHGRDTGGGRGRRPRSQCWWGEVIAPGTWSVAKVKVRVRVWVGGSVWRGCPQAWGAFWGEEAGAVSGILASGTQARPVPSRMGSPPRLQPQEAAGGSPKAGRRRLSGPAW